MIASEHDVDKQTEVITDYISFCLDECVPTVERKSHHDKPRVNRKIQKLPKTRHFALSTGDESLVKS